MFISSLQSYLYKTTTKYNIYPFFCDANSNFLERSEREKEGGEREDGERKDFCYLKKFHISKVKKEL